MNIKCEACEKENLASARKKIIFSGRNLTLKGVVRLTLDCQFLDSRYGLIALHFL